MYSYRLEHIHSQSMDDWLEHEESVKQVLGHPKYEALMVAADDDSLDHMAMVEIARQLDTSGLVRGKLW